MKITMNLLTISRVTEMWVSVGNGMKGKDLSSLILSACLVCRDNQDAHTTTVCMTKSEKGLCELVCHGPTHLDIIWHLVLFCRCSFMTNFGDGSLFRTLLQLPHLKHLNLYGTNLSNHVVEMLCSALKCSTCKVQELL